jgi:membrane protease YdiL (CAAX protease family)
MNRLYTARDTQEAHTLREFLAAHDVEAELIDGDACVFVNEADVDRAELLRNQFVSQLVAAESHSGWTCAQCQQPVESQHQVCGECGAPRSYVPSDDGLATPTDQKSSSADASPSETVAPVIPSSTRNVWLLWLELLAVLALTTPLYGGHSLVGYVLFGLGVHNTASNLYLASLLRNAFVAVVTLTAIRLSRDPWCAFGIVQPVPLDLFTGGIVCIVGIYASVMGRDIFLDIATSICSEHYFYQITHSPDFSHYAHGWSGLMALLLLAIAVGFSEEFVFRAYVLPRLEQLLRSMPVAVLVSAAIFGLIHWQRGIVSMFSAFVMGIVYGIAFVWTRRLWPVAIAHAAHDFSAFLYHAG